MKTSVAVGPESATANVPEVVWCREKSATILPFLKQGVVKTSR